MAHSRGQAGVPQVLCGLRRTCGYLFCFAGAGLAGAVLVPGVRRVMDAGGHVGVLAPPSDP